MLGWRWLYPGMRLKRWFFLIALSILLLIAGFSGLMGHLFAGVHLHTPLILEISGRIQGLKFADFLTILLSILGLVLAVRRSIYAVLTILIPNREKDFVNIVYQRTRLKRGPRIVAVGGGT